MKLYANVCSERATKGQGGNEYLKIIVRDDKQQCIAYLTFKPNKTCNISIIKDIKTNFEEVVWIGTDDDTKTKTCSDGACFNLGDDVNCGHHPKEKGEKEKGESTFKCKFCGHNKFIIDNEGDKYCESRGCEMYQ